MSSFFYLEFNYGFMVAFFISSILCLYKHFTIYNAMCSHLCLLQFTSFAFIHFVNNFLVLYSTTNIRNLMIQFLFSVIVYLKSILTYLLHGAESFLRS